MQQSWAAQPLDTGAIAVALSRDPEDATLTASRALLGVVARSVAEVLEMLTLPQFRILVVIASSGPLRMGDIARRVDATPSTLSRTIDRLEKGGWVTREQSPDSRREILIRLTAHGEQVVAHVTERRRREIAEVLDQLRPDDRVAVGRAFALFAAAAGEPPPEDVVVLGI
jgi:DNA-binding MarR family transcriptional regulator